MEYTYNIRPKKKTAVGGQLKKMGNQVSRDLNMRDSSDTSEDDASEQYVMRFVSEMPLLMPPPPVQPMAVQPPVQQMPPQQPAMRANGQVTQQTTTTTVHSNGMPVGGAGVNMSVNDPALGVNFNMSVGGMPGTAVQQQSTTTTTVVGGGAPVPQQQSHFIMPGYNGPIGCPWPMDQAAFSNAQRTIAAQSFEENRLQVAKQVFSTNCLTSAQVAQIMETFTFEDSRLDFAKFAYGYTFDLGNYFVVNNAFTFSSSIDELNAHISGFRR
jgi:hypothetical protein